MTEIIKLSKTVVLKSKPLTRTKIKIIENTIEVYKEILSIALEFGLKNKLKGHIKIRKGIYEEIKNKYPKMPTHYIYTASQDASTRIKSFISMKKRRKAYTETPEVRNVSLWLDDILFNYKDFKTNIEKLYSIDKEGKKTMHLRASTPNGRIVIPLKPHITNKISKELKEKDAVLIIEDLSSYFNQNIVKNSFKKLKHKLHNISAKKFLEILKNKCLEFGVKVVEVNPSYTSILCPNCGNRLSQLYKLADERALPLRSS
ncbi:IS200/IS605 family accessory protein TnpB-related protein [Methanocaldococcus lauensis]|nr:IS200/IS605 family accessory protein TnpB-related protein [Methanocaldococcus lauensis]